MRTIYVAVWLTGLVASDALAQPSVPFVDELDGPRPETAPDVVRGRGRGLQPVDNLRTRRSSSRPLGPAEKAGDLSDQPLILAQPEGPIPVTEDRLRAHLEVRATALRSNDSASAELALTLLEEARDALGAPNAIVAAAVLLREAQAAKTRGDLEDALSRTKRAIRLAPDMLSAHWAHIKLLVELDGTKVARIVDASTRMAAAWLRGFRNQVHLLSLVAAALLFGSGLSIGLLVVVLLARHLRYQAHDLSQATPKVIGGGEITLILVLALLLPGALGLGWPASIALGLGLTLAYQTRSERTLSVAGIVLLSLSPWLAGLAAPLVAFHGSRVDHLARVLEEAFVRPSEVPLNEHLRTHPEDGMTALVLGIRAARRSDLELARELLSSAVRAWPQDPTTLNNLGVVEYRLGEHERAERHLRAAAAHGLNTAAPNLNLSLIASDRGNFDDAERFLRQARESDEQLVASVQNKAGLPLESRMTMIAVPRERLWAELYGLDGDDVGATRGQIWRMVGGRVGEWSIPAWGLLALAIGLLGFRMRRPSGPCVRCGAPADLEADGGHCPQCQSVFFGSVGVTPAVRKAKERQVLGYQRRRVWLERVAALVPGCGALIAGKTVPGFTLLMPFCVIASLVLVRGWLSAHAWHVPDNGAGSWLLGAAGGVVIGLLSLMSVRGSFAR